LQRLHGLAEGTKDKYAQVAQDLENRIGHVNEELLRIQPSAKLKAAAAHAHG
jgi:hypothetical protein